MRLRRTLFFLFAVFVVYGTTIPFRFVGQFSAAERKLARILAHPLAPHDPSYGFSAPDIVQNLALFVPFGVLGVLAGSPDTRWGWRRIVVVTTLGAAVAAGVEAFQLLTRDRTASVIDLLADTLGACFGAVAANGLGWRAGRAVDRAVETGWLSAEMLYPAIVGLLVATIAAWVPFDATLDVGMIVPKIAMLRRDPWQYTGLNDEGVAVIQYALLAVGVCAWLATAGQRHAAAKATLIVVTIALVLEAAQIVIMSRMPSLQDAAVHAGGALLGAWLWTIARQRPSAPIWFGAIVVGTALAVAMLAFGPSEAIPMRRLYQQLYLRTYEQSAVTALTHVIEGLLAFVPLGFVTGHILKGRMRGGPGAAVTVAIAAAIAVPIVSIHAWPIGVSEFARDVGAALTGAGAGAWAGTRGAQAFGRAVRSWQDSRTMDVAR
jgi:VanZ family protein